MSWKNSVREMSLRWGGYATLRQLERSILHRREHLAELAFYRRLLSPGQLCFDVGANRGQSSEIFLSLGTRVIAFEPQVALHRELKARCARRGDFRVSELALGATEQQRELFLKEYDQVASLKSDWSGDVIGKVTVGVSTLDRMIEQHGLPYYCKIDVEGWELETLLGLTRAIPLISFEYHRDAADMTKVARCIAHLRTLADYRVNVRPNAASEFALQEFVPINRFAEMLPDLRPVPMSPSYGDIFVRCAA